MHRKIYLPFAIIERSTLLSIMTTIVINIVDKVLSALNFEGCVNPHYREDGIGKIGTTGFVLGIVGGIHYGVALMIFILMAYCPEDMMSNLFIVRSWSVYMALLCTFHFLEFFVTSVRQPSSLSYNSYVVNHGRSYTLAAGKDLLFSSYIPPLIDDFQELVGLSFGLRRTSLVNGKYLVWYLGLG